MKKPYNTKYDYNPETDEVNATIRWLIIVVAFAFAVYASYVVV